MIGTGIVHQDRPQFQALTAPTLPLAEIRQWAEVFVQSGMFKDSKSLAQAIVKIQAGQELGLPPFAAMRGFDVIEGKPAPNAGLTAALVRRSGRYDYRVLRSDTSACELEWLDHGRAIGTSSFTVEEAKAAGLAGKQVWRAYASDMLFARALTRGARRFCADVFLGSVYTPEELGADEPAHADEAPNGSAFNGPGSFTEATDAEFTEAEPAHADVESWRAVIEAAPDARAVLALFNRIGSELETEPYRQSGAYRIAVERFVSLIPDKLRVDKLQGLIDTLGTMVDTLQSGPVPANQKPENERVLALADAALVRVMALLPPDDDAQAEEVQP